MHQYNSIKNNNQHKFKSDAQKNAFKNWFVKFNQKDLKAKYGDKLAFAIMTIYAKISNFYKYNPEEKFFYHQNTFFEKYISKDFGNLSPEEKEIYYKYSDIGKHVINENQQAKVKEILQTLTMSKRHYKRAIQELQKLNKIKIEWDNEINQYVWLHVGILKWIEFSKKREVVLKSKKSIKLMFLKCWKRIQKELFPFIKEKKTSEEILNNIKANSPPDEVEVFDWSQVEDQED